MTSSNSRPLIKKHLSLFIPLVIAFFWPLQANAQIAIHADVNKTIVNLNEQITMTVAVTGSGGSLPDPQIPILSNFGVYSSGKSQSISIMNGQMETDTEYTYVLVPRFVGKGSIPPITVNYKGRSYQTHPITIEVLKKGATLPGTNNSIPNQVQANSPQTYSHNNDSINRSPAKEDVFVQAKLDKKTVFVNQQATLSIKFFTAVSLAGSPQYTPPKLSGFLVEELPPQRNGRAMLGGKMYYYSEIKMALFPVQSGRLPIGPATVNCRLQKSITVDPFSQDFFNNFFSGNIGTSVPKTLRSDPIILSVQPLPSAGRPANFSGAVGKFNMTTTLDRNQVNVGDAVNLTMTIKGEGNLKGLEAPQIPTLSDFHAYDTVSSLNLNKNNDIVQGEKIFKTVMVPRISGTLTIPKISFSYFDPQTGSYHTISTPALTLHANRGSASSSATSSTFSPSAAAPQEVSTISEDIRYLKPYQKLSLPERFLSLLSSAGPINAIPFVIFSIVLGMDQYESAKARNPKEIRKRQAFKKAALIIRQAQKQSDLDVRTISERLSESFVGYLADKIGQAPSTLTLKSIDTDLRRIKPNIPQSTIDNIRKLWDHLDSRRFAPTTTINSQSQQEASEIAKETFALIESIERELRP